VDKVNLSRDELNHLRWGIWIIIEDQKKSVPN
jgi:hypothetical protein